MVIVGQAVGSNGVCTLTIVAPTWNLIYFISLLNEASGLILFIMTLVHLKIH